MNDWSKSESRDEKLPCSLRFDDDDDDDNNNSNNSNNNSSGSSNNSRRSINKYTL